MGLDGNKTLISLKVAANDINSVGAEYLKNVIGTTKISQIDISKNPLGNAGIKKIASIINFCKAPITHLNISACKFT